jgi:phospholipid/cholesterol/gamma-HCH transport system permease protein
MSVTQEIRFSRPAEGELLVHLSGSWTLAEGVPSTESVGTEVERDASLHSVAFDTHSLTSWDTTLPVFLRRLLEQLDANGIDVNRSGLPEGTRRLLDLAAAVPERESVTGPPDVAWLAKVGLGAIRWRDITTEEVSFIGENVRAFSRLVTGRARFRGSDFALILQQCGAEALPIVTLVSFLVGLILAFMGAIQLEQFGAQIFVADLVALGMTREMGAMMTAVIMAGRTGASFAAHLGTMMVNEEIDALKSMGISPAEFLILPRLLALSLMMPLLCLYSDLLGIVGGAVVGVGMLDLGLVGYIDETRNALSLGDFGAGLFRASIYGAIIAISGCLRGMQCGRSASAVGTAATSAVVTSIVWIVVAAGIINVIDHIVG